MSLPRIAPNLLGLDPGLSRSSKFPEEFAELAGWPIAKQVQEMPQDQGRQPEEPCGIQLLRRAVPCWRELTGFEKNHRVHGDLN